VSAKTVEALCDVLGIGPGDLIELQKRPARQSR
jgi:DNA-binding Xre family transcriptional regulator